MQDTKTPFWNSVELVVSSLDIMNDVIQHLIVKKDVMRKASMESYAISLDIAEVLVSRYKVPFRTAHKLMGALVNLSVSNNDETPFSSLSSSDIKDILLKVKANITVDKLIKTIRESDSRRSIRIRNSEGSPNPKEQTRIIRKRKLLLKRYSNDVQKKKESIDKIIENITNTINGIVAHSNSKS
ncbi:MAG: hypothetical protein ACR2KF_07360 [Nitrososphaeraceae archaeon]